MISVQLNVPIQDVFLCLHAIAFLDQ